MHSPVAQAAALRPDAGLWQLGIEVVLDHGGAESLRPMACHHNSLFISKHNQKGRCSTTVTDSLGKAACWCARSTEAAQAVAHIAMPQKQLFKSVSVLQASCPPHLQMHTANAVRHTAHTCLLPSCSFNTHVLCSGPAAVCSSVPWHVTRGLTLTVSTGSSKDHWSNSHASCCQGRSAWVWGGLAGAVNHRLAY